MKTLILGIGNPLLGDDGVGFHIAQELATQIKDENIDVEDTSVDGLNLLELIIGYDKVIIVDAIMAKGKEVGEIYKLRPEDLADTVHFTTSPHNANLAIALEVGRKILAEQMPGEIVVFAIGIKQVPRFTEEMSETVKAAIPTAVNLILQELNPT
jgi:hydrogenase maturation protease